MTDQVLFHSKHARSWIVEIENVLGNEGLRVYRESPFRIQVQVRTTTKSQGRISSLSINAAQARELAAYLLAKAEELQDDTVAARLQRLEA